ncbi:MAG: CBS domain-containing protein [Betaproteobacteria bacterium]|nr:CBS domain-containing protein [Betaproteobacteria bacterium]
MVFIFSECIDITLSGEFEKLRGSYRTLWLPLTKFSPQKHSVKMCGIISDRDYAHKIVAKGLDPEQLSVGDIMTKNVITISREATIADCMRIMSERHFRHLPVAEGDAVVGMISMSDVMRVMMAHADDDEEWPM